MRRRPGSAGVSIADVLVACAVGVVGVVDLWLAVPSSGRAAGTAVVLVGSTASAWRRRAPVFSALVVVAGVTAAWALTGAALVLWPLVAMMLAMFAVGRHAGVRAGIVVVVAAAGFAATATAGEDNSSAWQFIANFAFIAVLMIAAPWAAGHALRRRESASLRLAAAAADEERMRIARELHDVVGHALGVIAVQAGAERATLPVDAPASTRETLMTIEQTTRDALAEMRRLVSVLRSADHGTGPVSPQPTLAQVDSLATTARASGLSVDLAVEGEPVALPPGVDLAAYRIVQEALTNAVRHSGGTHVRVDIRYLATELGLRIADDGRAGHAPGRAGHGLTGMRERVALYGGSLALQRGPGTGFVVDVRMPYPPAAT